MIWQDDKLSSQMQPAPMAVECRFSRTRNRHQNDWSCGVKLDSCLLAVINSLGVCKRWDASIAEASSE